MLRHFTPWFVVLLFAFSLNACKSGNQDQSADASAAAPSKAVQSGKPAFTLYETFEEFAPLLDRSNDTLYVINFWATWCAPCVEEMPYFETLHEKMQGKKVKVILVSLDFKRDIDTKLAPFLEKRKLAPEVVMLADGRYNDWIDRVSPEWSGAIPATILLKGGQKQFYGEQFPDYEALETWVQSML